MGDIVNLRQVRKQKKRSDKQKTAAANRLTFGRTKAEKDQQKAVETLESRRLDGHKRTDGGREDE